MPSADQTLQQGIQAVKGGNFERARRLFNLVVEEDPDSEQGWYWLGLIAPDQDRRIACFLRALEINPSNQEARDRLLRLGVPIPTHLDQAIPEQADLSPDQEETGPLPSVSHQEGLNQKTQPRFIPAVFEPLDDDETEVTAESTSWADREADSDLVPAQADQAEELQSLLDEEEEGLEPGLARRPSLISRLLPVLVILLLVVCASTIYLGARSGGLPFGLALAQASATPSPTVTLLPPTATNTPTPQPTPTETPIPPTPSPTPTLSPLDRLISQNLLFGEAFGLAQTGQYNEAILAWDKVVESAPTSAEAYYGRARSYLQLVAQNRQLPENTHTMLQDARADLDQAILIGPARGVYYLTRYEINDWLTQLESFREQRLPLLEQMLADVQSAAGYGLTTPFGDPNPGRVLLRLGRCQEALAYFGQQVAANPTGVPPASLYTQLARTYLCYGQLRGASLYVNMANSLESTPEREWIQAIILFNLGRYNETLDVLDQLLEANPDSPGDRYYLRALVHFQRREFELAQADLDLGSQHTPEQAQLAAYVSGLLARQSGDQAGANALFNLAEETLSLDYGLILDRVRNELSLPLPDRGIPILPDAIVMYQNDPPETIQPPAMLSEPDDVLLPARYDGSGPFHLLPNELLNLHLYPPVPVDILFVDSLTLRLSADAQADLSGVQAFLWDFGQGVWVPTGLAAGDNPVDAPSRFVNSQGDIYLRIENNSGQALAANNLNLILVIAGQQETGQP